MTPKKQKFFDEFWMWRALGAARQGFAAASPNPYVGCVLVKDGRPAGDGAHVKFGGPHAEIAALKAAGNKARGATLYVNLEPCAHWGKTPPCVNAIIAAKVKRVVAAMRDPNPLVRGKGFKALKSAGIQVTSGILENEARQLNRSFLKFISLKKPYIFLKAATSLDGKIATASGDSKWITSKESRGFAHGLRSQMDGILVGAETVRRDNPSLTSHGKGRNPVRIVLSKSGDLSRKAKIFNSEAPTWVFGNQPIESLLKELARRGISRLLVEGGGTIASQFIESGQIDEAIFFLAPLLIGGEKAKTAFEGRGFGKIGRAMKLEIVETRQIGPDLMVRALAKKYVHGNH